MQDALDIMLTGGRVPASEAKDLGIVWKVSDSPVDDALAYAAILATQPPAASEALRQALCHGLDTQVLVEEPRLQGTALHSAEFRQRFTGYRNSIVGSLPRWPLAIAAAHRPPRWEPRDVDRLDFTGDTSAGRGRPLMTSPHCGIGSVQGTGQAPAAAAAADRCGRRARLAPPLRRGGPQDSGLLCPSESRWPTPGSGSWPGGNHRDGRWQG
jgi:hypothetical protein